jgi:hypothetical protein
MTDRLERRRALYAVIALVAAWIVAAIVLVPLRRAFAWDEAVYFAKAAPDLPTITWAAERDIGFPALLWPVVAAGGTLVAARLELLLLAGLLAVGAYAPWATRMGSAAPAAALLFLTTWPALFYGTELYPHLVVALAIVGALGSVAVALQTGRRPPVFAALAFTAFAGCIRPADVLLVVAVAVPVTFALERKQSVAPLVGLLGGTAVGCVAWIVEAYLVFESPIARWNEAFGRTPDRDARRGLLTALAHRGLDADLASTPIVAGVLWVVLLGALAVAGTVVGWRRGQRSALLPALLAATVVALAYGIYWSDTGARFLIPAFALAAVPAGFALQQAWRALRAPTTWPRVLGTATCAVVLVSVALHANAARSIGARERRERATDMAAGRTMASLAEGRPCRFVAQHAFPQIEVASGCDGLPVDFDRDVPLPRAFRYATPGTVRFAVGPRPPVPGSPIERWQEVPVDGVPPLRLWIAPEGGAASIGPARAPR